MATWPPSTLYAMEYPTYSNNTKWIHIETLVPDSNLVGRGALTQLHRTGCELTLAWDMAGALCEAWIAYLASQCTKAGVEAFGYSLGLATGGIAASDSASTFQLAWTDLMPRCGCGRGSTFIDAESFRSQYAAVHHPWVRRESFESQQTVGRKIPTISETIPNHRIGVLSSRDIACDLHG